MFDDLWGEPTPRKPKRKKLSEKIKREVLDRQNNKCENCNGELTSKITHFHHVHNVADGGEDDPENIEALCANCHSIQTATETKRKTIQRRLEKKKQNEDEGFNILGDFF